MDPQSSTSFIPKEALNAQRERAGGMGLLFLIALLFFVTSLVAGAAAFGYGYVLNQELASDKASLTREEGAFDPASIKELVRMDSRLTQAKKLLSSHLAPSGIFDFLAGSTLQNVQFTSFSYALGDDGNADIELTGLTDTFSTMALQSDALGKSSDLRDVIFSNITVQQSGLIGFTVSAKVDPALISYSKEALAQAQASQLQAQGDQSGLQAGTQQAAQTQTQPPTPTPAQTQPGPSAPTPPPPPTSPFPAGTK